MKWVSKFKLLFAVIVTFSLFSFLSPSADAGNKDKKKNVHKLQSPQGAQPYVHQWFESKTKEDTSIFGQVYRPRKDLVVFEMVPESEKSSSPPEVTAVRIKTKDGKVYESKIRKVPAWFMLKARQNFQSPEERSETAAPVVIKEETL